MAHDLAMQICATDPRFLRKEDVTAEVLQREKEVLRSQAAATGKPENVLDRIVEGKLESSTRITACTSSISSRTAVAGRQWAS